MKRKSFLNRLTLGTGGALLMPSMGLLQACEYEPRVRTALTKADIPLLDDIGETFIPTTASSPGAKATEIGAYMITMYADCMPKEEQIILVEGLNNLDAKASKSFETSFIDAEAPQKLELLETIQSEAEAYYLGMEGTAIVPPHYFSLLKGLTLSGYFSSEIGMTQAREYLPLPGKFEACIPYNQGDKPWAT
ncbi:MAG: gluconate 2-dehydrogenase subunit 3 family protein [Pricia sp.]